MASWNTFKDMFAPAPKWTPDDIPNLTGKVIIVTGANTGIGKETARALLKHNAKVYLACRNAAKARTVVEDFKTTTGKTEADMPVLQLDLSDLNSVKAAVNSFLSQESRLDVLINNAGVMFTPIDDLTKHGHDMQFGTNVLGHFYFTQLLLPTLIASGRTSSDGKARVVNVSSSGQFGAASVKAGGPVVYKTLSDSLDRKSMGIYQLYFQSKAGNILFSHALHRKYYDQGIISISLNPGAIVSDLQRNMPWLFNKITHAFFQPATQGALTSLYAATSSVALTLSGKYLRPWARVAPNNPDCDIEAKQEELWDWLEGEVKTHAPA